MPEQDKWDQEKEDYLNSQIDLKLARMKPDKYEEQRAERAYERSIFGRGM